MRAKRPQDLPVHEFIDLKVHVFKSCDPNISGLNGRIIDETKNTFRIERSDGDRVIVQKSKNVFEFTLENDLKVAIEGDAIMIRPQDRIKKLFHKRKQLVSNRKVN